MQRRMKVLVMVLGLAAVLLVTSGVALATHSNPSELHACYNNSNGLMFFVSNPASCSPNQSVVTWNQTGVQGPQGLQGPQGNPGISGYERISVSATKFGTVWQAYVTCPAGKKVISGGYHAGGAFPSTANVITLTNMPWDDVTWEVNLLDPGNAVVVVFVNVICANVQ